MEENWKPLKKKYTSTYDINTGRNMCGPFGTGQGLDKNTKCGCKRRSTGKEKSKNIKLRVIVSSNQITLKLLKFNFKLTKRLCLYALEDV